MHPRNLHIGRYNFDELLEACSDLATYLKPNPAGDQTIDFEDPEAVLCLNRALLAKYYSVKLWMIPAGYLCPPIPGRADYIHHLADLIGEDLQKVRVLDVGVGANCIYPILGSQAYGWKFVGSEVDPQSMKSARAIIEANPCLRNKVRVVAQRDVSSIFKGVIRPGDRFNATMCNPPFHASAEVAEASTTRKVRNLSKARSSSKQTAQNFGGQQNELWCAGGEVTFIKRMITESSEHSGQVGWFTSLVSKSEHLPPIEKALAEAGASEVKVVPMQQGQKQSRFIAWRF
ncbi:MAG: 23S rRNA (adenine(1618)-N(6))-methyltransferase RlmF [Opitutaceae bacterium]